MPGSKSQREKAGPSSRKRPRLSESQQANGGLPKDATDQQEELSLPACARTYFPNAEQLRHLEPSVQDEVVNCAASLTETMARTMHGTLQVLSRDRCSSTGRPEVPVETKSVEDVLLADMVRLKGAPTAREFVDATIWRRIKDLNKDIEQLVASFESKSSKRIGVNPSSEVEKSSRGPSKRDAFVLSLKQKHMRHMAKAFEKDMDELRKSEDMDAEGVQFLLQCFEAGAEVYAQTVAKTDSHELEM